MNYLIIQFAGSARRYTYAVDADSYRRLPASQRTLQFPQCATTSRTYYTTVRVVERGERVVLPPYVTKCLTITSDGVVKNIALYRAPSLTTTATTSPTEAPRRPQHNKWLLKWLKLT